MLGEVIELDVTTRDDDLGVFVVLDVVGAQASVLVMDVHFAIGVKNLAYLALLFRLERGWRGARIDGAVLGRLGLAGFFCVGWDGALRGALRARRGRARQKRTAAEIREERICGEVARRCFQHASSESMSES